MVGPRQGSMLPNRNYITGSLECFSVILVLLILPVLWRAQRIQLQLSPGQPIKMGVLLPLSGPLAPLGRFSKAGLEVALEEVGHQVAGRRIELLIEDTEATPQVGLNRTRKLLEYDKVAIVLGPVSSAVAIAMRDYVVSKGIPWIVTFATTPSLTRELAAPNLFRSSFSAEQPQYPMGVYAREKLGFSKVAVAGLDYVAGHAEVAAFGEGFRKAGGQVVQEVFIPLGALDPAPFTSKIKPEAVDVVVGAALWGSDAVRFLKALEDYGIKGRVPIIVNNSAVADGSILPAHSKAVLGIRNYGPYAVGFDTPENRLFVQAVWKNTGKVAGVDAYMGYVGARAAIEALKAVKGRVEGTATYLEALRNVEFVGPAGRFKFDKHQNAVVNLYLQEVRETKGELHNVLVEVIARGVSQR